MDRILDAIGGSYKTDDSAPRRASAVPDPTHAGASAQTGGFVGADANVHAGAGGTGGLASSPNVPAPGSTINPATGLPHTAGLTRAELEAQRSAKGKERDVSEISGREQAARQLAGGAATVSTTQAIREGEGRSIAHTSTFSDEIKTGVKEIQESISPYIPNAIKGAFGSPPASPGQTSTPVVGEQRRGSLAALYNQVKTESGKIVHNLQERIDNIEPVSSTRGSMVPETTPAAARTGVPPSTASVVSNAPVSSSAIPATTTTTANPVAGGVGPNGSRRGSIADMLDSVKLQGNKLVHDLQAQLDTTKKGTLGSNVAQVGDNVKGFINEILESGDKGTEAPILTYNDRGGGASGSAALTGATAAAMSAGFAGVGQESATLLATKHELPATVPVIGGTSDAAGTSNKSLPSQENQGMLPGEVSAGAGALPGPSTEPGVALLPDEKKVEGTAGGLQTSTGLSDSATSPSTGSSTGRTAPTLGGLAAPLPATVLGAGAAKGATDLDATAGVNAASASPATATFASTGQDASSGLAAPPSGDRTTSMASVTAIKGGHVGDRSESKGGLVGLATAGAAAAAANGPQSTANGSHALKDPAPGAAHEAVGHPSAVGAPGTTRMVGSYPGAQYDGKPTGTETGASAGSNGTALDGLAASGQGVGSEIPPSKDGAPVVPEGVPEGRPAKWTEAIHNPAKGHETAASASTRKSVDDAAHRRKSSGGGGSEKRKSGLFAKIKDKLSHHDN